MAYSLLLNISRDVSPNMGQWAKSLFGQESFGRVGIVLAGTIRPEFEKIALGLFDRTLHSHDSVYHGHLVEKEGIAYPLVTNVYGAPAMVDVLAEMHDGGCRNVLFIGYAYAGFANLPVASLVVPNASYHFDGLYHVIHPDRKASHPDAGLNDKLQQILKQTGISYTDGTNISVPAVTFQLPHANSRYQEIKPTTVEMELASCYARTKDIGMRSAAVLVISDNRSHGIHDAGAKERRQAAKL